MVAARLHLFLRNETHQTPTGCLERGCGRHNLWPRPPPYLKRSQRNQIPEEPYSAAWETPFPAPRKKTVIKLMPTREIAKPLEPS